MIKSKNYIMLNRQELSELWDRYNEMYYFDGAVLDKEDAYAIKSTSKAVIIRKEKAWDCRSWNSWILEKDFNSALKDMEEDIDEEVKELENKLQDLIDNANSLCAIENRLK